MSEKRFERWNDHSCKVKDKQEDTFLNWEDVTDQTEQEKHLKQRVIDAVNDCPKKKVGYLVMEIKDRER